MGRKLKYKTNEERLMAQRKWAINYYYRNQETCKRKRMEKYYAKKINI
jgi:hypothetical protein